jgi:protein-tyrosine phosphatase
LRGRQVAEADFHHFDLILAMDENNLADLQRLAPDGTSHAEVRLFAHVEVPDPYTGGEANFEQVLDLVETTSDTWVKNLAARLGTS